MKERARLISNSASAKLILCQILDLRMDLARLNFIEM
jgi:hypothetical protein